MLKSITGSSLLWANASSHSILRHYITSHIRAFYSIRALKHYFLNSSIILKKLSFASSLVRNKLDIFTREILLATLRTF